jgi:hypothetical protein
MFFSQTYLKQSPHFQFVYFSCVRGLSRKREGRMQAPTAEQQQQYLNQVKAEAQAQMMQDLVCSPSSSWSDVL